MARLTARFWVDAYLLGNRGNPFVIVNGYRP